MHLSLQSSWFHQTESPWDDIANQTKSWNYVQIVYDSMYIYIYTLFKVDGSALFQSARIDGADFLNFDTRKGRDIHPRYFCGPRHLCQKMFQGCAIYARILKSKVSKPPFPFSSPFALNFPFLLPPFPFSFPSPLFFLLSLSPPFPPPFPLPFTNGTVR